MSATDEFGRHEVVDRSSIIADMFDRYVLEHPAVEADANLTALATRVSDALGEFYQAAGAKFLGGETQ